jgi:hypothetical protein
LQGRGVQGEGRRAIEQLLHMYDCKRSPGVRESGSPGVRESGMYDCKRRVQWSRSHPPPRLPRADLFIYYNKNKKINVVGLELSFIFPFFHFPAGAGGVCGPRKTRLRSLCFGFAGCRWSY